MTVDTVMEPRHLDDGSNHNDAKHADTDMDCQPDDGGSSSKGAPNGDSHRNSNKKSDKVGGVTGTRSDDKGVDGGDDAADDDAEDDDADDADDDDPDADADANRPPIKDKSSLVLLETSQESPDWQRTIGRVVRNVVSVRFSLPCAFDTSTAMSGEATGFIVDAERGYVLTNRHVVNAGPFWGYIVLDNHEEVDAHPVYRDPVHDFGILRFDPKAIKYMKIDGLEMRPDLAKVGTEIRVVGNDAGEKLCILQGVIGRLDRNAPEYEGYCDFNTCYYQANASGSEGSSGSPVVDKDGNAIALQAGGRTDGASTDYFLPLDRPLRALQCLRESKPILRGDIQCQFLLKPFDECRRLGLTAEWEATIRAAFPDATTMLVAEIVLPQGPSHEKIEEGDVLLKINGELLLHFIRFDEILDSSVGQKVSVLLQRGGKDLEVEIEVGDLHKITPDRFVTVAGGTFQSLSYQQARAWAIACQGVLVCESGGSWRVDTESGLLIQSVDQKKTPDLDTFVEVMRAITDKARVVITYKLLRDLHTLHTTIIRVDRHWSSKMKLAVRNDVTGLWDFSVISEALAAVPPERRSASFVEVENAPIPAIADLARSFVHVEAYMPIKLDGFPKNRRWGMGLVIDADKGLVVVSRAVVPFDLCDITVTVADSVMVDGRVIFLHPLQNYSVIQYDPALVDAPVLSATLSDRTLTQGAPVYFVGFSRPGRIVHTATTVTEITTVAIPANVTSPRYRALNVDAITIDTPQGQTCGSGVLVSTDGTIQALWLTYLGDRSSGSHHDDEYHLGLATQSLLPVVNDIRAGIVPKLRILSVEFRAIPMSQARVMGVPEEWIRRVAEANKALHQLFMVGKLAFERGGRHGALKEGDILLTLNGRMVSKVSDLDIMYREEVLDALIVRDTEILEIKAPTVAADDVETDYAISFCGALIHQPHHAVRQQISKLHSEVYISARTRGSPAMQYCLAPTNFITHVNSKPTPDMKAFLAAVQDIPDNTYFRLRAVSFDSVPWVVTMKKNEHYFPTVEWIKDPAEPNGWRRITHEGTKLISGEGVDGVSPTAMCDTSALDCLYC